MVICNSRNHYMCLILYCQVKCKGVSMDRKLMRNGNGWALCLNATILDLLKINPRTDMVEYTIERDKLIITKSSKKREDIIK